MSSRCSRPSSKAPASFARPMMPSCVLKDGDDLALQRASRPDTDRPSRQWPINRQLDRRPRGRSTGQPVHVHDLLSDEGDEFPDGQRTVARAWAIARILSVPLLREGESIGAIVLRRIEVQSVQRQADRAAADLRRPGRDRHRQCPPVRRGAGQDARSDGGPHLPDRQRQYPAA